MHSNESKNYRNTLFSKQFVNNCWARNTEKKSFLLSRLQNFIFQLFLPLFCYRKFFFKKILVSSTFRRVLFLIFFTFLADVCAFFRLFNNFFWCTFFRRGKWKCFEWKRSHKKFFLSEKNEKKFVKRYKKTGEENKKNREKRQNQKCAKNWEKRRKFQEGKTENFRTRNWKFQDEKFWKKSWNKPEILVKKKYLKNCGKLKEEGNLFLDDKNSKNCIKRGQSVMNEKLWKEKNYFWRRKYLKVKVNNWQEG